MDCDGASDLQIAGPSLIRFLSASIGMVPVHEKKINRRCPLPSNFACVPLVNFHPVGETGHADIRVKVLADGVNEGIGNVTIDRDGEAVARSIEAVHAVDLSGIPLVPSADGLL